MKKDVLSPLGESPRLPPLPEHPEATSQTFIMTGHQVPPPPDNVLRGAEGIFDGIEDAEFFNKDSESEDDLLTLQFDAAAYESAAKRLARHLGSFLGGWRKSS